MLCGPKRLYRIAEPPPHVLSPQLDSSREKPQVPQKPVRRDRIPHYAGSTCRGFFTRRRRAGRTRKHWTRTPKRLRKSNKNRRGDLEEQKSLREKQAVFWTQSHVPWSWSVVGARGRMQFGQFCLAAPRLDLTRSDEGGGKWGSSLHSWSSGAVLRLSNEWPSSFRLFIRCRKWPLSRCGWTGCFNTKTGV